MAGAPADAEGILRALVGNFSAAPLLNGKRMRDLMRADRDAFRLAALTLLHDISDVRGARYLVTMLLANDLLIQTLSDPTLPLSLALRVSQTAAKVDPQLHFRLMRYLVAGMLEGQEIEEASASRLLEVLSPIADSNGIQPFLRQLLLHPSPRIRSKITLLAGRGQAGVKALARLVKDADARVRANAIEALWTGKGATIIELFREALADANNRVRGNAVVGLYLAGDSASIPVIVELSKQPAAVCRATAAWAMGKTEDPRFLPFLGHMMGDSKGQLRKSVFRAIEAIKKGVYRRAERPALDIEIVDVRAVPDRDRARIRTLVTPPESLAAPELHATDFMISTGGFPVVDYSCEELLHEVAALGFLIPRRPGADDPRYSQLEAALLSCLHQKPKPEQWAIFRYRNQANDPAAPPPLRIFGQVLNGDPSSHEKPDGGPSLFTGNASALRTAIDAQSVRSDGGGGVVAACYGAIKGRWPVRGTRNLIAFVEEDFAPDSETLQELTRAALSSQVAVYAVCGAANACVSDLCRETGGICRVASDPESIRSQLRVICGAVKRQYILEFAVNPTSGDITHEPIRLQVHSIVGSGEAVWPPIPEQPAARKGAE